MRTPYLSTIFCVPDRQELIHLLQKTPDQWGSARILKQDKGTTVTLIFLATGAVVVKHHSLAGWRRFGDTVMRGSPARRAWYGARLLQAHGFLVPRPLAVLEKQIGGIVWESFYVCEGLLSQVPLHLYWQEQHSQWSYWQRCTFLQALAEFLQAFHAAGLYAGDMKDANLLVEEVGNSCWQFYLVDLDQVRYSFPLSQRRRLKNLVQLERTLGQRARKSERLFFLYHYLGTPLPSLAQRRVLLRRLIRMRNRKDREYAQRRARWIRRLTRGDPIEERLRHPAGSLGPAHDRVPISCCIVCFNEERTIRRCLESVKWCDEMIVVDSFSTDRTVAICREYTSRIIQRPWPGYVEQKRFALSQTTHEWVLNVDADEEVSPTLQREILAVLQRNDPAVDGFYIPRLVYYLGRWWWHGWYPGYRLRLFRKTKVRWGGVNPHEKVILRGQADRLSGNLYHYTYADITDHLRTINSLTDIASQELALQGKRIRVSDLIVRPLWRFLRFYILSGCLRNGVPGFFVAVTSAFYVFLKYAKLWERSALNQHDGQVQDSPRRPREGMGRRRRTGTGAHDLSSPFRSSLRGSR